jgi:hypothetical protein
MVDMQRAAQTGQEPDAGKHGLAFLGGRYSDRIEFAIPDVIAVTRPVVGTVAVVEEVTDRPPVVATMVTSGWFAELQSKGLVAGLWDDSLDGARPLMPMVEKAGGVPAIVLLTRETKVIASRRLSDSDTLESVEKWIEEVARYAD